MRLRDGEFAVHRKTIPDPEQHADMDLVWGRVKGAGVLDYVTCWHVKAAQDITGASRAPSALTGISHPSGLALEKGSARFQRVASGIPAGRRAKAAGDTGTCDEKTGADAQESHESSRQDAGKSTLEARAPHFLRAAYVSTNSISQGEQVGILWGELFQRS